MRVDNEFSHPGADSSNSYRPVTVKVPPNLVLNVGVRGWRYFSPLLAGKRLMNLAPGYKLLKRGFVTIETLAPSGHEHASRASRAGCSTSLDHRCCLIESTFTPRGTNQHSSVNRDDLAANIGVEPARSHVVFA